MSSSSEWMPLFRRMFVFAVKEQERYEGSVLYKAKALSGFLTQSQRVCVLSVAKDCHTRVSKGEMVYISDGFELSDCDLDLWEQYQDQPEFKDFKAYVDSVGGKVVTSVISEGSLIGTEGEI